MSELEKAQQIAETALQGVNLFPLQGDKVDFLLERIKEIANLPQLTIPKSVADELLKFRKSLSDQDTELLGWLTITTALYRYEHFSENFIDWWDELEGKANNLAIAYLNPLTRDLVKVVEG